MVHLQRIRAWIRPARATATQAVVWQVVVLREELLCRAAVAPLGHERDEFVHHELGVRRELVAFRIHLDKRQPVRTSRRDSGKGIQPGEEALVALACTVGVGPTE